MNYDSLVFQQPQLSFAARLVSMETVSASHHDAAWRERHD